ncbi:MAG: FHA domain-containing protein [Desulfobacteraceae bacterium]|jgi:pSer/pThr/pTyr-binding forkhead associated (FHA) protein
MTKPDKLLILDLRDQHVSVSHDQPMITMGRDAKNRIAIKNPKVSRLHARIEMRKDRFILTDQSTNGTYIYTTGRKSIHLRRDEYTLEGDGIIYLGKEVTPESPDAIHYHVI